MGKNKGFSESKDPSDARRITGNNHLFVIGIDDYQHCGKLSNAVRDAEAFGNLLIEKYQFEAKYLKALFNEDATHRNIKATFRGLVNKVKPEDNLIVYFSGHGHYDEQYEEAYWVPVEAEYEAEVDYISYSYLLKVIKALKARHVLFIVDSCYSGAAMVREKDMAAERLYQDPSRWLLASGRNEVVPDGVAGGHSPFAEQLLDIFHRYSDDQIRISTLVEKITTSVTYNSKQTPIGRPIFGVGDKGGEFVFYLKKDEKADWKTAESTGTISAYQQYLRQYPEGVFVAQAKKWITALEEEQVWKQATEVHTVRSYNYYLDRYDKGKYSSDALKAIRELELQQIWQRVQRRNTTYDYRTFIRDYPESTFVEEAQKRLRSLIDKEETQKTVSPPPKPETNTQKEQPPQKKQKETPKKQEDQPKVDVPRPAWMTLLRQKGRTYGFWGVGIIGLIWGMMAIWPENTSKTQAEINRSEPTPKDSSSLRENMNLPLPPMIRVEGGTFDMGSNEGTSNESPLHMVKLGDFYIGKYEVTVEEYLAFCQSTNTHWPEWLETGNRHHIDTGSETFYKDRGYSRIVSEKLPVVGVSWNEPCSKSTILYYFF